MGLDNTVFAVVGAKGGVGKTTTSLNLAAALARTDHSVVAVELDVSMANFVDFLDVEGASVTLHDVFGGGADVADACRSVDENFAIAPSGTDLTGYAETDLSGLADVVATLRWHYDVVVLDTPAGLGEEIVRSLEAADAAILVSTPRVASIRNAKNTLEFAERVDTAVRGLVLTKSGTGASPGADRIAEFLGVELLGHVPEDDAVPHSQDRGETVLDYAPHSGAAHAYEKIAGRLLDGDGYRDEHAAPETQVGSDDGVADEAGASVRPSGDSEDERRSSPSDDSEGPANDDVPETGPRRGGEWPPEPARNADGPPSNDEPTVTEADDVADGDGDGSAPSDHSVGRSNDGSDDRASPSDSSVGGFLRSLIGR